ncbi:uncharacterized protein LOC142639502 [Castanea sativa]|uniref:uncharacterized protein LOC142639502 n=1 Tax=Castanea sativa TaxID=21020 RepID=UPI003F6543DB
MTQSVRHAMMKRKEVDVFWDCNVARGTWRITSIPFEVQGLFFSEFTDFLWYFVYVQNFRDDVLELVVMVAWCLWFSQNQARQGNERLRGSAIVHKARYLLDVFYTTNLALPQVSGVEDTRWIPPTQPWYKLNVDGATFRATQSSGVGVVIRDDVGYVWQL